MFDSTIGRQILTLFQSDRLIVVDSSLLAASVDLLAAYDRAKARRTGGAR
jgi:hypothetical protein